MKFKINPILSIFLSLFLSAGCAAAIGGAKGIAGVSTRVLEEERKEAIKKTFNCNCETCYNESKRILKNKDAYIYAEDFNKKMIALYVSETDTTPVGVFFKVVDSSHTQVEVSSPSKFGKEYISGRLFLSLGRVLSGEKEEVQLNAQEGLEDK